MNMEPLVRFDFEANDLMVCYIPPWKHPNKKAVYDIACASGHPFSGTVSYFRWPALALPAGAASRRSVDIRLGHFEYPGTTADGVVEWHMNFADYLLFNAYDSALLAQDELQVAEHPVLGALRDTLIQRGCRAKTFDSSGTSTPITISGVQRRCAIDTSPRPEAGRAIGLYGNRFARAPIEQVQAATQALIPPTMSNILAMSAPGGGEGTYSKAEIEHILVTAYTGFSAARRHSQIIHSEPVRVVIRTGFWGCGAYGGNRMLMTLLQALAAELAQVDLIFYGLDTAAENMAKRGCRLYEQIGYEGQTLDELVATISQYGFDWGESDGN